MSTTSRNEDCPHTDPILARFLDGDSAVGNHAVDNHAVGNHAVGNHAVGSRGVTDDLDRHLDGCLDCQSSLRRARRLDALLASSTDCDSDDRVADRLFAAALPEELPEPSASTSAGARVPRFVILVGAFVVLVTGVGLGLWLSSRDDPSRRASPRVATPAQPARESDRRSDAPPVDLVALPANLVALPERRTQSLPRAEQTPPRSASEVLVDSRLADDLLPGVVTAAALHQMSSLSAVTLAPLLAARGCADRIAIRMRLAAGRELLRSRRSADRLVLVAFLANAEDDRLLTELLDFARSDRALVAQLRVALRQSTVDPASLRTAARLGHPSLDQSLLRLVRRDHDHAKPIADATSTRRRPRRVALLLELWSEISRRGQLTAGARRDVELWFRSLPAPATDELIAAAIATRRLDRRLQCLEAIGWHAQPEALAFLFEQIEGNHRQTALAAGHALSQQSAARAVTRVLSNMKHSRRRYVLLAALCNLEPNAAGNWLRAADLSVEERDFLRGGEFSRSQFAIAAALCRRHGRLAD